MKSKLKKKGLKCFYSRFETYTRYTGVAEKKIKRSFLW